ncbi:MAG TPA: double-strand break repair protein AddB, partial [Rhodospirillales bacterium]|nr:double-strand break repair protein AddB [Rhodospirillales bacterium]
MTPPSLYTIAAGMPFLDALAAGLLAQAGTDPAALSKTTVLLPTRRACRALAEAFLRRGDGRPVLLPALTPLGDLDEDELAMLGASGAEPSLSAANGFNAPPAVSGLHRQMMLSRMILALDKTGTTPDQAARLALELARLLDQVHTERLSLNNLKTLVPDVFAAHWQKTLEFLKILTEHWPGILEAEGGLDPAARRNLLLEAQAEAWRASPPCDPVIAAGSTGSIPATADLLNVIARLPKGAVILPGLERFEDEETWAALNPSHPQFGMKRLLEHLGVLPRDVTDWPAPGLKAPSPLRAALMNGALRPASAPKTAAAAPEALDGVTRIDCPSP